MRSPRYLELNSSVFTKEQKRTEQPVDDDQAKS
jgi:hypothetical protein